MNGEPAPKTIDLDQIRGLTIVWSDGTSSRYSIVFLRRNSPAADARVQREAMASNPLAVLPSAAKINSPPSTTAELVGNYALRIRFPDGHHTGIYSWSYLRSLNDPETPQS